MTLIKHELKQSWKSLAIWTASIGFFIVICVLMYPEMKGEMENVSDMFASMGAFTEAFGMDRLNFGTLIGFYGIECGNILGIGGAFFAALIGISSLAKEEKDRTAEFLLTHPISRRYLVTSKLISVFLQIVILNVITFSLALASIVMIGEDIPWKEISLLHLAYFLVQVELTGICLGISAFLRRGGMGLGIGIASMMYFLNIVANISDSAKSLKYVTPFGFADSADIIENISIDATMVAIGMLAALICISLTYWYYQKKDIH